MKKAFAFTIINLMSSYALAFNYNELEIEGYSTAAKHEMEFETAASWSTGDQDNQTGEKIFRNSLAATYGITDTWELGLHFSFDQLPDESFQQRSTALAARTRFFEAGEMFIDTGLELEAAAPQKSDEKYTFETKLILEKNIGKFTFAFNPALEFVQLKEANDEGKTTELEKSYAAQMLYNYSSKIQPHIDLIGEIADSNQKQMLLGQVDMKIAKFWSATVGVGTGLTSATESKILTTRLEVELY